MRWANCLVTVISLDVRTNFRELISSRQLGSAHRRWWRPGRLSRPLPVPIHGAVGAALIALSWPVAWLQVGPVHEYTFFPLWLGYILVVDAMVLRRKSTSLLVGL